MLWTLLGSTYAGPLDTALTGAVSRTHQPGFADWAGRHFVMADEQGVTLVVEGDLEAFDLEPEVVVGEQAQVMVPWGQVQALIDAGVRFREPVLAKPKGEVYSKGVDTMNVTAWTSRGATGQGIRVAILDVGFAGYGPLVGTELPRDLEVRLLPGKQADNHGTAVAEIVHDIAPKADITLVQIGTDLELLDAIGWVKRNGFDVVNASIGFDNRWHADGWSEISVAVDDLVLSGTVWVAAAGNENRRYALGALTDDDQDGDISIDGREGIYVNAPGGQLDVSFRWSEPMGSRKVDLSLAAYNLDGSLCARTTGFVDEDPFTALTGVVCQSDSVLVVPQWNRNITRRQLDGFLYAEAEVEEEAWSYQRNLTVPADASRAITVAGCDLTLGTAPTTGSRGPTDDFRLKPDFCAPYQIQTATASLFEGSSAASPHVAGVAALALSKQPGASPSQVKSWLRTNTVDFGDDGPDPTYGKGGLVLMTKPPSVKTSGCQVGTTGGGLLLGLVPLLFVGRRRAEVHR